MKVVSESAFDLITLADNIQFFNFKNNNTCNVYMMQFLKDAKD